MSLPVLTQSKAEPPTSALPPIPASKGPRKSLPITPSRLKAPRPSALPTPQHVSSTSDIPTLESHDEFPPRSAIPTPTPNNNLRRTISFGSFPQPPNTISRPGTSASMHSPSSPQKVASRESINSIRPKKIPRASTTSIASFRSETPTLLNSSGDSKSVSVINNKRASDGQSSGSPPQSRSSSANGSYSTNATTIEDVDEDRGRSKEPREIPATVTEKSVGPKKDSKGNVIVSVRVRPDLGGLDNNAEGEWMVDGRRALIAHRGKENADYIYDNVFGTYDDNAKVYDAAAKRLVRRVMEGYQGTVFAYGMTGTGKTFSMQGTMPSPGIIPLAITDIFSYIRETPHREFLLRVSYLEIYNEKIHDLLAASSNGGSSGSQEEIKLREDKHRGVYASPLKEEIVQSPTQLLRVIHRGDMARRTGSTQFNARSSRSHAVVQIVVESRERNAAGSAKDNRRVGMLPSGVRVSTLSLIDLAGSERAAEDKERRTEGAHINKSLLTLGTVIAKLSGKKDKMGNPTDKDGKHLPYRDSKLTRLLQPALAGNALISILCTIQLGNNGSSAPSNTHTIETLNTLKFASRAKNNIVSNAKKASEELGGGVNAGLLERYRSEIANLRAQLENQQKAATEKKDEVESDKEQEKVIEKDTEKEAEKEAEQRHEEQMLEMQLARTALKERIEHLNRLILCSKSTGVNSGTASALGMHPRMSGSTINDFGPRSVRSSASQSTLGTMGPSIIRHPSMASLGERQSSYSQAGFSVIPDEDDEAAGEYGDGRATLQAQNRALQADLQDKNRYIATLEKRLLQARRSSHSRTSMGFSKTSQGDEDTSRKLEEKDSQIADLQRTVLALRSAMRQRSLADLAPEHPASEIKSKRESDGTSSVIEASKTSRTSSASLPIRNSATSATGNLSPLILLSPEKAVDSKRKSVDEMSRMLDEMIQDKVESGQLIKGRTGSVRVAHRPGSVIHSRRNSTSSYRGAVAPLGGAPKTLRERESVTESITAV